jgi:hypothetical protein
MEHTYHIQRAFGELRRQGLAFIEQHHYTGSNGGSGYLFVVLGDADRIVGACLIGPASSMAAERAIVAAPWRVWQIKRLVCLDDCVPESQLMRHAMREVAASRGETLVVVSYADPVARDERTGRPLLGWVYLAAGLFYVGETSQPRYAVIDDQGRSRSTRQGKVTLKRSTLPPGWRMVRIPAARVWLAVVPPLAIDGKPTSRRWRKLQYLAAWRALAPSRRVAAQQWIDFKSWDHRPSCVTSLGRPKMFRGPQRLQPALWPGSMLRRTAGPVWVPVNWQGNFLDELDVDGEATIGRVYAPRLAVKELV